MKAIECYNKAICFAETGSEELSLAFANRSAIYFGLHLYDACLKNIKIAKEAGYPKRLMRKLDEREKRYTEAAEQMSQLTNFIPIEPK